MSQPDKPLLRSKAAACGVLPCDGIPRYYVKGSPLRIKLPYSSAWSETFKLAGGTKREGVTHDAKPVWVFTPACIKRLTRLNQLHLPHAKKWQEALDAARALGLNNADVPREIDKPVEQVTPEPCSNPPTVPSSS